MSEKTYPCELCDACEMPELSEADVKAVEITHEEPVKLDEKVFSAEFRKALDAMAGRRRPLGSVYISREMAEDFGLDVDALPAHCPLCPKGETFVAPEGTKVAHRVVFCDAHRKELMDE